MPVQTQTRSRSDDEPHAMPPSSSAQPTTKSRGIGFKLLVLAVVFGVGGLLAEGLLSLALSVEIAVNSESLQNHCVHDPDLGWAHTPSQSFPDLYGSGIGLTTNSQRLRADRDYTPAVPDGRYRVVCLGDSFTMGYGVADDETYEAQLQALDPQLEVVNMGMGGYGIDQCYLWYLRDGERLETDLLLFVVIRDNFYRMLTSRFAGYFPKPTLALAGDTLTAQGVPVPDTMGSTRNFVRRIWRATAFNRGLRSDSPLRTPRQRGYERPAATFAGADKPFAPLAEAVFAELARISKERGQAFAVAYLPDLRDLASPDSTDFTEWLGGILAQHDIAWVDLTQPFRALTPSARSTHYLPDGHFTVLGNRVVAETIDSELRRVLGSEYVQ